MPDLTSILFNSIGFLFGIPVGVVIGVRWRRDVAAKIIRDREAKHHAAEPE